MSIFGNYFDTFRVYVDPIDTFVTHVEKTPEIDATGPEERTFGTSPADKDVPGFRRLSVAPDWNGQPYVVDFSGTLHMMMRRP